MTLRTHRAFPLALLIIALAGCSDMLRTQQKVLSGGAIGAGAVLTGGCISCDVAIGGAIGAGTGYVIDKVK